ncbi:MAG TPA: hypothetical protein PK691_11950, partial [Thermomicrobiales bacterium]|nr:hypothetical protein [Thermomicrobiales bacterium]
YQKIIAADPNNGNALIGLARLYRSWSPPRNEDAITFFKLAIERAPDSAVHTLAQQELASMMATPVASPSVSPVASPTQ